MYIKYFRRENMQKPLVYRGVAQLVARQFWELDVVSSSLTTPTIFDTSSKFKIGS